MIQTGELQNINSLNGDPETHTIQNRHFNLIRENTELLSQIAIEVADDLFNTGLTGSLFHPAYVRSAYGKWGVRVWTILRDEIVYQSLGQNTLLRFENSRGKIGIDLGKVWYKTAQDISNGDLSVYGLICEGRKYKLKIYKESLNGSQHESGQIEN